MSQNQQKQPLVIRNFLNFSTLYDEIDYNFRRFYFQLSPLMADSVGLLWLVIILNFLIQFVKLAKFQSQFFSFSLRASSAI